MLRKRVRDMSQRRFTLHTRIDEWLQNGRVLGHNPRVGDDIIPHLDAVMREGALRPCFAFRHWFPACVPACVEECCSRGDFAFLFSFFDAFVDTGDDGGAVLAHFGAVAGGAGVEEAG